GAQLLHPTRERQAVSAFRKGVSEPCRTLLVPVRCSLSCRKPRLSVSRAAYRQRRSVLLQSPARIDKRTRSTIVPMLHRLGERAQPPVGFNVRATANGTFHAKADHDTPSTPQEGSANPGVPRLHLPRRILLVGGSDQRSAAG